MDDVTVAVEQHAPMDWRVRVTMADGTDNSPRARFWSRTVAQELADQIAGMGTTYGRVGL